MISRNNFPSHQACEFCLISQDVIGKGHDPDDVLPEGEPSIGRGLILQKEIMYFRQGRGGLVRERDRLVVCFYIV